MAAKVSLTQGLKDEYDQLFALAKIRPENVFEVDAGVAKISDSKAPSRLRGFASLRLCVNFPPRLNYDETENFAGCAQSLVEGPLWDSLRVVSRFTRWHAEPADFARRPAEMGGA